MRIGEIKTEKRYAWFPTVMDNGKTIWLKSYNVVYKYEKHERRVKFATKLHANFYFTTDWHLIETYLA